MILLSSKNGDWTSRSKNAASHVVSVRRASCNPCLHERGSRYFCRQTDDRLVAEVFFDASIRQLCLLPVRSEMKQELAGVDEKRHPNSAIPATYLTGGHSNRFHLTGFRRRELEAHIRAARRVPSLLIGFF